MKKMKLLLIILAAVIFIVACASPLLSQEEDEGIITAEEWADEFPDQYSSYLRNSEMVKTTFGGSEPYDYLEAYPDLRVLYAGMGFSKAYYRSRGHVYSLEDVIAISRPKPGASCLSCKTPDYLTMLNEFGKEFYAMDFDEMASRAINPISCFDCHRNTPGEIVITRNHLQVALDQMEMEFNNRNLVCAQCHVEYYIDPVTKEIVLPWSNGITVDGMEQYFDDKGYADWIHPTTGSPLLKVQHPEFETFMGSVHANLGMSCVDCHMPRMENDAGDMFLSHHWTSPIHTMQQSCMSCHAGTPEDLLIRVENLQRGVYEKTNEISALIVELIDELTLAVESGSYSEEFLDIVRAYHRKAQWRWDFVFVENSTGFHNSQLAHETLDAAREFAEKGLALLRDNQL